MGLRVVQIDRYDCTRRSPLQAVLRQVRAQHQLDRMRRFGRQYASCCGLQFKIGQFLHLLFSWRSAYLGIIKNTLLRL